MAHQSRNLISVRKLYRAAFFAVLAAATFALTASSCDEPPSSSEGVPVFQVGPAEPYPGSSGMTEERAETLCGEQDAIAAYSNRLQYLVVCENELISWNFVTDCSAPACRDKWDGEQRHSFEGTSVSVSHQDMSDGQFHLGISFVNEDTELRFWYSERSDDNFSARIALADHIANFVNSQNGR